MAPVINPSIDISEFRKNPNKAVNLAGRHPLAVLTDKKPSFYVFSPEGFAEIAEIVSDLELAPKLKKRMSENGKAVRVKIEDLFVADSP
jgi:PHD/YefM family antitoxin component YafN of YafNO toxin-antitoxin module